MFRAESKKMPHTCWFFHEVWEDKKSHVFKVIPCRLLRRKVPSQRQRCDQIPPSSGDNQVPTCHTCLWKSLPSCLCFEMTFKNLPLPKELLLKTTKDFKSGVRICQQSQQTPIFLCLRAYTGLFSEKKEVKYSFVLSHWVSMVVVTGQAVLQISSGRVGSPASLHWGWKVWYPPLESPLNVVTCGGMKVSASTLCIQDHQEVARGKAIQQLLARGFEWLLNNMDSAPAP